MGVADSTHFRGQSAERLAAAYLERRGYRVLRLNYRIRAGEIDIIAEEGEVLCFVEVRSRRDTTYGHPLETIDRRKQRRLTIAAGHYLKSHPGAARPARFDVVGIVYKPQLHIQLVKNAFPAAF